MERGGETSFSPSLDVAQWLFHQKKKRMEVGLFRGWVGGLATDEEKEIKRKAFFLHPLSAPSDCHLPPDHNDH